MGFAPVFNIPLISDIFFLIFALKKDCNKIFILLQPLPSLTARCSLLAARLLRFAAPHGERYPLFPHGLLQEHRHGRGERKPEVAEQILGFIPQALVYANGHVACRPVICFMHTVTSFNLLDAGIIQVPVHLGNI